MRAAIYARYSSEHQHERSIDDQVRLCRELAARHGAEVVGVYADYAISGAHLRSRPEANRLLADAKAGRVDMVVAEALDRLSRDQEDIAGVFKRLSFAGVRLVTSSEGEVGELHIGLKGTMNALFLRDLAQKIRRGQRGRIEDGLATCGNAYGYDVVRELDARGEPLRGKRRINEAQATIVRRIFDTYAAGTSPRAIAAELNRQGIPSPSGREWNASTINGSRQRKNGILHNELYVGRLVYNRQRFVKDPETGRRQAKPNPPSEWLTAEVPELRIVTDELWDRCQRRKAAHGAHPPHVSRRPKYLFSGMVRCGVCGGAYTSAEAGKLRCSTHREKGTCNNGRKVRIDEFEQRVLDGLRTRLLAPDAMAAAMKEYHEERRRLRAEERQRRERLTAQLSKLDRQIDNLVDAIAEGVASAAMKAKLTSAERERGAIAKELATVTDDEVVELHPSAIDAYRAKVAELQVALATDGEVRDRAMGILRQLIDRIEVHPVGNRGTVELHVVGVLPKLFSLAQGRLDEAEKVIMVVAEEGFEPPTQGL
jgi:site-specific DNA recombinase